MSAPAETIAAIATAAGVGGIGVLRVSGPAVPTIARALLGREPQARHAHFCRFRDAAGHNIDQGLLLYFAAPASFTGEHVLELHCHGSPVVLGLLRKRLQALGARAARPGEFSERAFLNGKLDLAQAEAVADLVASGSEAAARAAMRSLEGAFSERVNALTEAVIALRVWIEAAIDFPEEEIDFLAEPRLLEQLDKLRQSFDRDLGDARRGQRLRDGLHAVIVGRPNAGKSSLLNALAGSDRAIVTATPGTTRDLVSETVAIDEVAVTLVDTAGLHHTEDAIEAEGMRRARAELARADLGLLVCDEDARLGEDLELLAGLAPSAMRLVVHSKCDLGKRAPQREVHDGISTVRLSARTGEGLDLLHAELKALAGGCADEGAFSTRARHVQALENARALLEEARHALVALGAGELAAEALRACQRELDQITGRFSSDDLLGRIFADFCIGK